MNAESRFRSPQIRSLSVAAVPITHPFSNSAANTAAEALRAKRWNDKGQRDAEASREKLRVIALGVTALLAAASIIWLMA